MSRFDELLAANGEYAAGFSQGDLASPPALRLALVTCMDARIHPEKILGLNIGDAHVIRNAGGRAQEALRSLVISQRLLGTREIVVLHHTDCGMLTFTNQQLADRIQTELGADPGDLDFMPFSDLEQSIRDDVALLRASPLIPKDIPIAGAIYDVHTGKVHQIVRA